jgi:hypothetical protein
MKPLARFSSLALLAAAATLTGCSTVKFDPSGETAAVYQFGEFRMLVNTTAPVTTRATEAALKQLDLYKTSGTATKFDARLEARARNDQKILVNIAEVNSRQTLVRIRWGAGGDLANSRALFDAIERNLGK